MYLPININIDNKKILVVGAGNVAIQKVTSLLRFTRNINVIGKAIHPGLKEFGVELVEKSYDPTDLKGVFLVYVCTDDHDLNHKIKMHCEAEQILCNVADDPLYCDFISPAIYQKNEMSVAVCSGGVDVRKSVDWRNRIRELIKDW